MTFISFLPPCPLSSVHCHRPVLCHRPYLIAQRRHRVSCSASSSSSSSSNVYDRIKDLIPLSAAFASLSPPPELIPTGPDSYKLCCPFHNDTTPSLHLSDSKQLFHCFGCGVGGSVIDFELLRTDESSVRNALQSLAAKFPQIKPLISGRVNVSDETTEEIEMRNVQVKKEKRVRWGSKRSARRVLEVVARAYEALLWGDGGERGRVYMMNDRGLSERTLKEYGVGMAGEGYDFVVRGLGNLGYQEEEMVNAGVARISEKGFAYDFLRGRVVTPIRDLDGGVVALAGRLVGEGRGPKYVNTAESVVFKKGQIVFGGDVAKKTGGGDCGFVLLVEGYMDVMTVFEYSDGKIPCVASMGTGVAPKQLDIAADLLVDEINGKVIVNFDGDEAGIRAAERLCDVVAPKCRSSAYVHIAVLPPDVKDPDEFLARSGSVNDYVQWLNDVAMPWYEWRGRRYVLEELAISEMEAKGVDEDTIIERMGGSDLCKKRQVIEVRPDKPSEGRILKEDADLLNDALLVGLGAPEVILEKARQRMESNKVLVSKNVIEKLASIVDAAQMSIPGFNYGEVVRIWADQLTDSRMSLMTSLFAQILKLANEKGAPWRTIAPVVQSSWMPPPPWVDLKSQGGKKHHKIATVRGESRSRTVGESIEHFSSPGQQKRSLAIAAIQEKYLIPILKAGRMKDSLIMSEFPRHAVEEMILRSLIFATEVHRVDALEKLLETMVHCEEKGLPFWTNERRDKLFGYLADVEGDVTPEEMATELENNEWWNEDMEGLFIEPERLEDEYWGAIRMIELKFPVEVVEMASDVVAAMAGKVAARMAAEDAESVFKEAFEAGGEMQDQILENLQESLNQRKFLTPIEQEIRDKEDEKERKTEENRKAQEILLEQIKSGTVPYPSHFKDGENYDPEATKGVHRRIY